MKSTTQIFYSSSSLITKHYLIILVDISYPWKVSELFFLFFFTKAIYLINNCLFNFRWKQIFEDNLRSCGSRELSMSCEYLSNFKVVFHQGFFEIQNHSFSVSPSKLYLYDSYILLQSSLFLEDCRLIVFSRLHIIKIGLKIEKCSLFPSAFKSYTKSPDIYLF